MASSSHENRALDPPPHRPVPALQCYLAYGSALLVGIVAWRVLRNSPVIADPFWIGLLVSCICTVVIWVFSIANGNSSVYDPYWVIAPPLLALALKASGPEGLSGSWSVRQIAVVGCLVIWACRYHIFYAWPGWRTGLVHEDWRYEDMRRAPVPYWLNSLLGMHLFPSVLVYFAFAPAAHVLLAGAAGQPAFGLWDVLGVVGALSAVAIEFVADTQMRRYRRSAEYRSGGTLRDGLWKYSRHPNYFGEASFWLSMVPFAVGCGLLTRYPILMLSGPVLMFSFFRFSCGLTDRRSLKRRPDYAQLMDEVSAMVPRPPRSGRRDRQDSRAR